MKVQDTRYIIPVSLKVKKPILTRLQKNADRHARGNLSEWLRYTGLNYTPKKGEQITSRNSIPDFF